MAILRTSLYARRIGAVAVLAALVLPACVSAPAEDPRLLAGQPGLAPASATSPIVPQPTPVPHPPVSQARQIGGLAFSPVTYDQLRFLREHPSSNAAAASIGFRGPGGARRIASGNYDYAAGFGAYPDGDRRRTLAEVLTHEVIAPALTTGPDAVERVIRPVLDGWAPDAALVKEYWRAPKGPQSDRIAPSELKDEATLLRNFGWPLVYRSIARGEQMAFYVMPDRTLIVWTRWQAPIDAPPAGTLSEAQAVERLQAALQDPAARGWEELAGVDYLLGTPYRQPADEEAIAPNVTRLDPLYLRGDDWRWQAEQTTNLGTTSWWVYGGAPTPPPTPVPAREAPGDSVIDVYYAEGEVDAKTGVVIRFTRPHRVWAVRVPAPSPWASAPAPAVGAP